MKPPEPDGPAAAAAVRGTGDREDLAAPGQSADGERPLSQPTSVAPAADRAERLAGFARRHALFGALLVIATVVRVIAMLGYPGALLYGDSQAYVSEALHMQPNDDLGVLIRPTGYAGLLELLHPLHSMVAVVAVQSLLGLGGGVAGYALLRRRGLPGWGATLAMVPVLLSAYAVQLEHFVLSDTLFGFLVIMAVVVLMWWPDPPLWACGAAGLLLGLSALVRSQGLALVLAFVVCMLYRLVNWRSVVGVLSLCAAFAIPVAGYATWFHSTTGVFNLTSSDGAYLWARVTTFADCAKIKPPPGEKRLCMSIPVSERIYTPDYLWVGNTPIRRFADGAFGKRADQVGLDFALRAIREQPLAYATAVWDSFSESFLLHDTPTRGTIQRAGAPEASMLQKLYAFPATSPAPPVPADVAYFRAYDPASLHLRLVQPFAGWILTYQRYVVVAGPLLAIIALTGLAGALIGWRRFGAPVLLPWLTGIALVALPAITAEFDPRYVVCSVPPLCIAAAISFPELASRARRRRALPSRDSS